MPSARSTLALLAPVLVCAISAWLGPPAQPWHTDFAKALAEARQTGKPVFVTITCRH
jgi:hypothetical protein